MPKMPPLRAALILDGPTLPAWSADAISLALERERMQVVAILVCTNNVSRKNIIKHFGYYLMRVTLMRPQAFHHRQLADVIKEEVEAISFAAELDGAWQRIPDDIQRRAATLELDVVLKFGMGLLRDPHLFPARFGVLSYHHGDPYMYRGRPVGFYELDANAPHIGAVVQRLTNTLDGGVFLAKGRFRIEGHSYRDTLESVYTGSSYLLEKALAACAEPPTARGRDLGKICRLPSNTRVVGFLMKLLARKAKRLAYGAFGRKAWRLFEADQADVDNLTGERSIRARPLPLPQGAQFVADPFYIDPEGRTLVCERMPRGGAHGDIVRIGLGQDIVSTVLTEHQRHFSYPYVFHWDNRHFLIPEVAAWSAPMLLEIDAPASKVLARIPLQGLEQERLLDPSLLEYEGAYWLFTSPNRPNRKMDTLLLWRANQLAGPYVPHPMNPVVFNPRSARPGGRILMLDGRLLRFGQDNSASYGAGLTVMEIQELTAERYREQEIGRLILEDSRGPHTIDFAGDRVLVDGYRDVFDPFAWVQRLRSSMRMMHSK